jgi:hypothetical protein
MHNLPTSITLAQFEAIDGALNGTFRASDMEAARAESRLFDALIDALGYSAASAIPSLTEYAADLVTACLTGRVETLDVEAA